MVTARRLAASLPPLPVLLPPLAVAALVVVNAWSGLMPGVGFWDTGEFQAVLPTLGTAHPTGYPTYVLLGFVGNLLLAPIGEPAFRVTVLSLLAVAAAAGLTVVLVRRLTDSGVVGTLIGIATGLGLATTPVVWSNATRADPHPIHLMFVALLLLALVRWEHGRSELVARGADPRGADRRLLLAAVVFGLAAGNHSLTLLLAPPIVLYVFLVEPRIWERTRFVLTCIAAAFATLALVYLELPIRGGLVPASIVYGRPATWDGFWYIALAEQFRGSLANPLEDLPGKLDELIELASGQLGLVAILIPPAYIAAARRAPRYTLLTGAAFVITVLFNAAYSNADIQRYYLGPILFVWTWIGILAVELANVAGIVVAELAARLRRARLSEALFERASIAAAAVLGLALLMPTLGELDARRESPGIDRSGDRGAQAWLDETLPALEQGAAIVSWWSTSTPLWYAQSVLGERPDLFIVDDRTMLDQDLGRAPDVIARYLTEGRPIYAIRIESNGDLAELTSQFDMTLVASGGNTGVWRVNGRLGAGR